MNPTHSPKEEERELMHHSSFFLLPTIPKEHRYALVIVDQTLPKITRLLWAISELHLCTDGGTNRLYNEMPNFFPHEDPLDIRKRYKPDVIIVYDWDAIKPEVLDFYKNLGTEVIDLSFDQDTTNVHKCVVYIRGQSLEYIILVTDPYGGRFDEEMGSLNVLYRFSTARIVFINDINLTYLLPKTHCHVIKVLAFEGPTCGLIPLGKPARNCTTTGLVWNLFHTDMRIGGLISTSNEVQEETVTVKSDADLLWTIAIQLCKLPDISGGQ